MQLTCTECKQDFEDACPFGENVTCPHCGVELETDYDESFVDGEEFMYAWVVGKVS
jgi:rRNA maturation endonuclease Nob1